MPQALPFLQQLRLSHLTEYRYVWPVRFGPHQVPVRPRAGHDLRLVAGRVEVAAP